MSTLASPNPVRPKVKAGAAGAATGASIGAAIIAGLDQLHAVNGLPLWARIVGAIIALGSTSGLGSFVLGYAKREAPVVESLLERKLADLIDRLATAALGYAPRVVQAEVSPAQLEHVSQAIASKAVSAAIDVAQSEADVVFEKWKTLTDVEDSPPDGPAAVPTA